MRIRFIERTVYDTDGPGKGPVYEKDSVHDVPEDQAERWFRRGKAVQAAPEPPPAAPAPAASEPEAEPQVVNDPVGEPAPAASAEPAPPAGTRRVSTPRRA